MASTEESTIDKRTIFSSYSRHDEVWRNSLIAHLKELEDQGRIGLRDDHRIDPGVDWYPEIEAAMARSCPLTLHFLCTNLFVKEEIPYVYRKWVYLETI